ncbi:MAG: hydrogenase maturation protease [Planctomycetota bacterium]|jgi:hydrogenase maturation protease
MAAEEGPMETRIICVGNRLAPEDDVGPRVYDVLAGRPLPENVRVIDGGLGGIDLLPLVEGAKRAVFVDTVVGFGPAGKVVVLDESAWGEEGEPGYGHGDGLAFLLWALPAALGEERPRVHVVGAQGPVAEATVREVAETCLAVAGCGADAFEFPDE